MQGMGNLEISGAEKEIKLSNHRLRSQKKHKILNDLKREPLP